MKLMCEKYSNVEHVFDVWHVSKSIQKKLHHVSTTKVNSSLQLWSKSIANHVWWAAESCEGDTEFLEEKYLSLLKHVSNVHQWEDGYKITGCEHADLPQDNQTLWLVKDSNEYNVLEKIMTDKQFVRDEKTLPLCSHLTA